MPGREVTLQASLSAFGTWPLGLSYGHFSAGGLRPARRLPSVAESAATHQIGVHRPANASDGDIRSDRATLVGGATIKYVRGTAGTSALVDGDTVEDALDTDRSSKAMRHATSTVDLGVMADFEQVRVGLTLKNLTEPDFGTIAEIEITASRRPRVWASLLLPIDWPDPCYGCGPGHGRPPGGPVG